MAIRMMVNQLMNIMYTPFNYEGFEFRLIDVVFACAVFSLVGLAFERMIWWFRNGGYHE